MNHFCVEEVFTESWNHPSVVAGLLTPLKYVIGQHTVECVRSSVFSCIYLILRLDWTAPDSRGLLKCLRHTCLLLLFIHLFSQLHMVIHRLFGSSA